MCPLLPEVKAMLASIGPISMLVLSILVAVGGVMGFIKAKSKVSLIAGLVSAVLLVIAYVISLPHPHHGMAGGAAVCAILCVVFGIRLKKTGKFMPAGMLLILCGLELLLLVATISTL